MVHFSLASLPAGPRLCPNGWDSILRDFDRANAWRVGPDHLRRLVNTAGRFLLACGAESADGVTVSAIERWLGGLAAGGLSVKTCINQLSAIDRFCDFLYARGLLLKNPARLVRRPRAEQTVPNVLSRRELACVMRLARRHDLICPIVLASYAGLRVGELRRLRWPDIDIGRRRLVVRKSKSKRPRVIPLHRVALAMLRTHRRRQVIAELPPAGFVFPGGRGRGGKGTWTRDQPRGRDWWLKRALRPIQDSMPEVFGRVPSGQCGRGWHIFRHTWVTRLILAKATTAKIASWAGHANLMTLQRYIHLAGGYDKEIDLM